MKNKINMLLLFISCILFIPKINALTIGPSYNTTDKSNHKYYSDSTINELWSTSENVRVFCLDHGLPICEGNKYYYYTTKYEGPACALTDYGWYSYGDEKSKSGTSGTSGYHNIIRFIQYYSDSSFSCKKYLYSSGSCSSDNKSATEDTTSNVTMTKLSDFTLENNYYISSFKVTTSGSIKNFVITSDSDVIITNSKDSNENLLNKTISDTILYVKIDKDKVTENTSVKLNIVGSYTSTCNYKIPGLKRYNPYSSYSSSCQRISFITWKNGSDTKTFSKESNLSINVTPLIGTIKITKYDSKTNQPLANVKFKLYKENGEVAEYINGDQVLELTTDSNGEIIIDNLNMGNYILKETSSLPNYLKLNNDILIKLNSTYEEVKIANDPIIIQISKQDITNKKELEGATIVIKDENNNIVKEFISTNEKTSFYISKGTYTLNETIAPSGYDKIETTFKFKVNEDGSITLLTDNSYISLNDNIITLYNEVQTVEVPNTFKPLNYFLVAIGIISISVGALFIYKALKENN